MPSVKKPKGQGTYIEALVNKETKQNLLDFIAENNIMNGVKSFHCTVLYSRVTCPDINAKDFKLPITAHFTEFKLFEYRAKKTMCLVAVLDCPELNRIHYNALEQHGATSDYLEYIPHITLSYDFQGEFPSKLPSNPTFATIRVKPLDLKFDPNK